MKKDYHLSHLIGSVYVAQSKLDKNLVPRLVMLNSYGEIIDLNPIFLQTYEKKVVAKWYKDLAESLFSTPQNPSTTPISCPSLYSGVVCYYVF